MKISSLWYKIKFKQIQSTVCIYNTMRSCTCIFIALIVIVFSKYGAATRQWINAGARWNTKRKSTVLSTMSSLWSKNQRINATKTLLCCKLNWKTYFILINITCYLQFHFNNEIEMWISMTYGINYYWNTENHWICFFFCDVNISKRQRMH